MSYQGTVKAFREDKGFGFITAEDGTEVFVHVAACVDGGQPQQGDTVVFDVEESQVKPGQMQACNVSGGTGQMGGGKGKGKVATGGKGHFFGKGAAKGVKGVQQPMFQGAASPVMQHSQVPCRFFAMGTCAKGWQCPFAHGGGAAKGGAFGGKGKGKDGKTKNKSPGHLLPRTRISEAPFSGTVVEWKGKYGWIQPAETIEHEKAEKHGGRLFFSKDSIVGGVAVDAGATVEYHIFEDVSGIGAEEVTVF